MMSLRQHFGAFVRKRQWLVPTIVGALLTLIFVSAFLFKPQAIVRISDLVFDQFQRQHPRPYDADVPVRIIDIDNESIERIGQWPWPRTIMSKFNNRLADAGAAVIAYDIIFSETDRTSPENMMSVLESNPDAQGEFLNVARLKSHDAIFADSFKRTNVVTGMFLVSQNTPSYPKKRFGVSYIGDSPADQFEPFKGTIFALRALDESAAGAGSVSFRPSGDGVIRTAPLFGRIDSEVFPSLSLEALRVAQGASTYIIKSNTAQGEWGDAVSGTPNMASLRIGAFDIPTTHDGKINVYFTKRGITERYIPAWKILSDNPADLDWDTKIAGNIVFVGTGAEGLKDLVTTPFGGGNPGVVVHAQVAEQIISEQYLNRPYWAETVELFGIIFLGLFLTLLLPRLSAVKGVILTLAIANIIYFTSYWSFVKYQYLVDPAYALLAVLVYYVLITLTSYYMTESQRSRIQGAFGLYLSPQMVKQVSENPDLLKLGGEEREITILFMDIRSFSKISEHMQPQDITTFLNKFLTPMTDILQNHKATIDKYMGDAIVAFWNAPVDDPFHEHNAARAVLDMQNKLAQINADYRDQDEFLWPDNVSVGIGLNTGICCVGNLGSEQRFSYSMIGDAANLSSRIEGLTKHYGVPNLIGSSTAASLHEFALLEADIVAVVGRAAPERIFMILGDEAIAETDSFKRLKRVHDKFLRAYRERQWGPAKLFCQDAMDQSASYNLQRYYETLLRRIKSYEDSPPDMDWDGVFIAEQK